MNITLKLYATLSDYLPDQTKDNKVELSVRDKTTIDEVVEQFNLPHKLVSLVLVNGVYVYPTARITTKLKEGDVLAIWPPIAGG